MTMSARTPTRKFWITLLVLSGSVAAVALFAEPKFIRASGSTTQIGISILGVGMHGSKAYFQPPREYGEISSGSFSLFSDEAVAYFKVPSSTIVAERKNFRAKGLKAFLRPSNGKFFRVQINWPTRSKELIAVQFPTTWPDTIQSLDLMLRDENGREANWTIHGIKQGAKKYKFSGTASVLQDGMRVTEARAWVNPRNSEEEYPSVTVRITKNASDIERPTIVSNVSLILPLADTSPVPMSSSMTPSMETARITNSRGWHAAETAESITASYKVERLFAPYFETVQFEEAESEDSHTHIYRANTDKNGCFSLKFTPDRIYQTLEYTESKDENPSIYKCIMLDGLKNGFSIWIKSETGKVTSYGNTQNLRFPRSFKATIVRYHTCESQSITGDIKLGIGTDAKISRYFRSDTHPEINEVYSD